MSTLPRVALTLTLYAFEEQGFLPCIGLSLSYAPRLSDLSLWRAPKPIQHERDWLDTGMSESSSPKPSSPEPERCGKGNGLAHWNAVAAELFEACDADTEAELETKAAALNAEMSKDLADLAFKQLAFLLFLYSDSDCVTKTKITSATGYMQLSHKIGHGLKQAGDVVFFLQYSMLHADGSLKHMRLCVTKTSNPKTQFEDEEQETAAEVEVNPVSVTVLPPQTSSAAPASSSTMIEAILVPVPAPKTFALAPASSPASTQKPTEDFSPALVKDNIFPDDNHDGDEDMNLFSAGVPVFSWINALDSTTLTGKTIGKTIGKTTGKTTPVMASLMEMERKLPRISSQKAPEKDAADDGKPNGNEKKTFKLRIRLHHKQVDDETSEDAPAKKKQAE
ncbi:hypothetical protein B0H19DRAFT_1063074 [Mycena capillaripes]|nr:hypothetical protein B0H19DRAFT_1063074 [Mycena capillaripes]